MSAGCVLELEHVSKTFLLRHEAPGNLKVALLALAHGRWPAARRVEALRDVSLRLERGELLGIVGPNGSGKSTLLKLMAGILPPSTGTLRTFGRAAPLLELGVGFHPELTGSENLRLNASLFGLTSRQIAALYEPTVAFSELEDFIDAPVKSYSQGMQMRLGFAVAMHVPAELLLIDEVLAVGDEAFQAKCLARLEARRQAGTAVVLVSHDLEQVARHCERALLMADGKIVFAGAPGDVVATYRSRAHELGLAAHAQP